MIEYLFGPGRLCQKRVFVRCLRRPRLSLNAVRIDFGSSIFIGHRVCQSDSRFRRFRTNVAVFSFSFRDKSKLRKFKKKNAAYPIVNYRCAITKTAGSVQE